MSFNVKLELNEDAEFRQYIKELINNYIKTTVEREAILEVIDQKVDINKAVERAANEHIQALLKPALSKIPIKEQYATTSMRYDERVQIEAFQDYLKRAIKELFMVELDDLIRQQITLVIKKEMHDILINELSEEIRKQSSNQNQTV